MRRKTVQRRAQHLGRTARPHMLRRCGGGWAGTESSIDALDCPSASLSALLWRLWKRTRRRAGCASCCCCEE